ncbi:thioredoxin-like protein [Jimgerdemannia flammicorona]|uniref:Thioredoxin-like protein n=1 Tax=Jimgerdemannia flammicorona TaxID=994334 RepID=A0A433DN81_9FUNG|nr:thioredoxin-like protein [Jimgerdemannia flammicorona]
MILSSNRGDSIFPFSRTVEYDSNILVMRSDESSKLKVYAGQRTLDLEVIRQADGVPIRLCDTSEMLSVGKFRAMVFAGDLSVDLQILGATADVLSSVVRRFGVHTDALEILTIVIAEKVNRLLLPKLLAGRSVYGDRAGDGSCHFGYGVDVNKGVVVLVRPDGWIGCCAELGNNGVLERYFDGFLVPNA